jgi:hypothetical protein
MRELIHLGYVDSKVPNRDRRSLVLIDYVGYIENPTDDKLCIRWAWCGG